jgi:hypothetical protein
MEELLMQFARPSIRMVTTSLNDESSLPLGASKIGGRPDLPPSIEWATFSIANEIVSLPFVAQINLQDVTAYDVEQLLPSMGMLYFFSGPRYHHRSNSGYQGEILFYDGDLSNLERRTSPDDIDPRPPHESGEPYTPCQITFIPEINLDSEIVTMFEEEFPLDVPDDFMWNDFYKLVEEASYPDKPPRTVHRLLGAYFGNVELAKIYCQLFANTGKRYGHTNDDYEKAELNLEEWQLLLQIDWDANAHMSWHDAGSIAFFMRPSDLKTKRFDKAIWRFTTG